MKISDFIQQLAEKLKIDEQILINSIDNNLLNEEININLDDLLNNDEAIGNFEENNFNFIKLKKNLGKLQLNILVQKFKKSKTCQDIINSLLEVFSNKIRAVNEILIEQLGSGQVKIGLSGGSNYFNKYVKYKTKYLLLKHKNKYL